MMATTSSMARLPSELSKALAAPWNWPLTPSGNVAFATSCTRDKALPSDAPLARPNEIVTAPSWPAWLMVCGPTVSVTDASVSSGTTGPALATLAAWTAAAAVGVDAPADRPVLPAAALDGAPDVGDPLK